MLFLPRFKLLNLKLLLSNNFTISTQPNEPMLLRDKFMSEICWTRLIKWTTAVQSAGARRQWLKSTALKPISSNLLWTTEPDSLFSYMHFINVTAKWFLLPVGQLVTVRGFTESSFSYSSITSLSSFSDVVLGRSSVNISIGGLSPSPRRPAKNCITIFHSPSLMCSATNLLNSASFMVSTICFAARNSCVVKWMKQNWASCLNLPVRRSGRRWKSSLSTTSSLTSFEVKISFLSLMPLKAILASGLNSGGQCFDSMSSRRRRLSRYLLLCRKKKSFVAIW